MSGGSSNEPTVSFTFHALVTIDEMGNPYGEATTEESAVAPGGYVSESFQCFSKPGYGVAEVSFDVDVPVSLLRVRPTLIGCNKAPAEEPDFEEDEESEDWIESFQPPEIQPSVAPQLVDKNSGESVFGELLETEIPKSKQLFDDVE